MQAGNTRRRILDVALDLFSVYGYEATSVAQIAELVGIRKASLYSHFSGKKEILDTLGGEILEVYRQHSVFVCRDWIRPDRDDRALYEFTEEKAVRDVLEEVRLMVHDPKISRARRLLIIEQFRDTEFGRARELQSYRRIMDSLIEVFRNLMRIGMFEEKDPELTALEFYAPISLLLLRIDRDAASEPEAMRLIEAHVRAFYRKHLKEGTV